MSTASPMVALPKSLLHEAERHAASLGVSTERWLEITVAERLRLEEETRDFFAARAGRASGRSLREILHEVGDNPPDAGDEL